MTRSFALVAALAVAATSSFAQNAPAPAKPAPQKRTPAKPAPKKAAPPPEVVLPQADAEQINAAERTYFGPYACDFNQTIDIQLNPKFAGYVDVKFGKLTYTMKPVLSSTGALRLEDVTGRTLLLQIANKSMLMDVKAGRRLVDNCIHEKQRGISEIQMK